MISDLEYDQLFAYLKGIEEYFPHLISSNSPTQSLIGQLADWFQKAEHLFPLLSLENSYQAEDLRAWDQRCRKIIEKNQKTDRKYCIEPKFDGLSVEIVYQNWHFTQAISRGDGKIGEDITLNVRTIRNLPKTISYTKPLRLRGEIMLPKSKLALLNQERELQGQNPFSNTRNAAAGSIKLLDSWEVAKRGLVCYVYEVLWEEYIWDLKKLWLPIFSFPFKVEKLASIEEVIRYCLDPEVKHFLDQQDYDFDGLVIKVCENEKEKLDSDQDLWLFSTQHPSWETISLRQLLGATEHHPRRAIAYKFPAQQVVSQILSVDFQVGRTGIITPVANLQPVQLSGASISRVSLHNFDFIQEKQIRNRDFVRVQRSGEVIPYIIGVVKERRDGSEDFIVPPLLCPACQSPVNNIDIHYYCTNPACPAQMKEKIAHFVSRDAMDISGIGEAMIELLVQQKILTSVADLYSLTSIQNQVLLRKFPSFWEKKISELVVQLEQSKTQALWRILHALGIPNIGKKTAQDLADYLMQKWIRNLDDLLIKIKDRAWLGELYGIGEKILDGIQIYFSSPETLELLRRLEQFGVHFSAEKGQKSDGWWYSFSLTGVFPLQRAEIIQQMQQKGYSFHESPTTTTTWMLIGEKPWSKAQKAQKMGIEIINGREAVQQRFALQETQSFLTSKEKPLQGGLF